MVHELPYYYYYYYDHYYYYYYISISDGMLEASSESAVVNRKVWTSSGRYYRRDLTKGVHGLIVRLLGSRAVGAIVCSDPNVEFEPSQIQDDKDLFTKGSLPQYIRRVSRSSSSSSSSRIGDSCGVGVVVP